MTKLEYSLTEGEIALALAVDNLADLPHTCMKHLHNWRKFYFNSKGIYKTKGIDWSKTEVDHNQCDICFKRFRTALGFHKHYPRCVDENK